MVSISKFDRVTLEGLDRSAFTRDHGDLVAFEEGDLAGVLEDGGHIGGDQHFAFAEPDHHAAGVADAGGDDLVWFIGGDDHDAVMALEQLESFARGAEQVVFVGEEFLDQVDDDLGVGLGVEL